MEKITTLNAFYNKFGLSYSMDCILKTNASIGYIVSCSIAILILKM